MQVGSPRRGALSVAVLCAEYEEEFVEGGAPSTYCIIWILEPTRRQRRRTALARKTMGPTWEQTFAFDDTRADATAVIDVWRTRGEGDAETDEYFGKVTLRVADLRAPTPVWHELVQGRIQIAAGFVGDDGSPDRAAAASDESEAEEVVARPAAPAAKPAVSALPVLGALRRSSADAPVAAAAVAAAVESDASEPADDDVAAYDDDEFEEEPAPPAAARMAPPPPLPTSDAVRYFEYTHCGGSGKENQDAFFALRLDASNYVWAVLDGHGHDNGRIASEAARDALRAHFADPAHFARLRTEPTAAMEAAFARANDAVRAAILAQPRVFERDGQIVMEMEVDEYCPLGYDVVDGGTTASVAALVDGRTLVYAAVGDSCSVLSTCARGVVTTRELVCEHSALNKREFELIGGGGCAFVYEYPDMYEQGHLPVWQVDEDGNVELSQDSIDTIDSYGVGFKTERGDRAAFLLTPEHPHFSQMSLAVTRTLGDFYHQHYGVTHVPEVVVLDLKEVQPAEPSAGGCVLLLASDGVWDHWMFEAAMERLIDPRTGLTDKARADAMMEETRAKGEQVFGNTADNLTAITVLLPRV